MMYANIKSFGITAALILMSCLMLSQARAQGNVNFDWKRVGPDNFGGRTRAIAATDGGRIWAGSTGGGLWYSDNWGQTWTSSDAFNQAQGPSDNVCMAVSSIAIDPNNPQTIYVGTGDWIFNFGISKRDVNYVNFRRREIHTAKTGHLDYIGQPGQGVFVSTDGGATFSNLNATWATTWPSTNFITSANGTTITNPWLSVSKVVVNASGRSFAGTLSGVFYSNDRYETVSQPTESYPDTLATGEAVDQNALLSNSVILDIETSGNTVYVTNNKYVFISRDGGQNFTEILGSFDFPRDRADDNSNPAFKQRIEIAVAPSNPNVVYVAEIGGSGLGRLVGVWRSRDAGVSWERIASRSSAVTNVANTSFDPTGQLGRYTLTLAVDNLNPDYLLLGSLQLWEFTPDRGWYTRTIPLEVVPNFPGYVPRKIHNMMHYTGANGKRMLFITSDREIIRTVPSDGELIENDIGLIPATGLYFNTSAYSVAPTISGELIAGTANAGVLLRSATQTRSWRQLDQGSQFPNIIEGKVATSIYKADNMLAGGQGFQILRSLDDGGTFERFYEAGLGVDSCIHKSPARQPVLDEEEATIPSPTGYPMTPFVLDETFDLQSPFLTDTAGDPNPKMEQYLFVASVSNVFLVRNPFGSGNDLATWIRLNDNPNQFSISQDAQEGICAMAISGDNSHTLYVGTANGRIFRFMEAHRPCLITRNAEGNIISQTKNPAHILTEITPANTPRRWITSLTVNHMAPETLIVTYGGYTNRPNVGTELGGLVVASFNANDMENAPLFYDQHHNTLPDAPIYSAFFNPDSTASWLALGTEYGVFYCESNTLTTDLNDQAVPFYAGNQGEMTRVPVYGFGYQRWQIIREKVIFGTDTFELQKMKDNSNSGIFIATFGNGIKESSLLKQGKTNSRPTGVGKQLPMLLFPNPAEQAATLRIKFEANATVEVQLIGIDGRLARSYPAEKFRPGHANIELNLEGLSSGLYMVRTRIQTDGNVYEQSKKLMVR